jgi:hypothetical protein
MTSSSSSKQSSFASFTSGAALLRLPGMALGAAHLVAAPVAPDDTSGMTRHQRRPRTATIVSAAALLVATAGACESAKQNHRERSASSPAVAAGVATSGD